MPFWDSMLISTAQARKSQFGRHRFTRRLCTFSDMKCMLHGRSREIFSSGSLKRGVMWQQHGCHVLRSKGSIPDRGVIFGTWAWGCWCVPSAAFRMTSPHDFVAGAVLLKHGFDMWTFCRGRACRERRMRVKLCFLIAKRNLLRRSCMSIPRNAGKVAISDFQVQPSSIGRAECQAIYSFIIRKEIFYKRSYMWTSCTRNLETEILHTRSAYRDLAQEIRMQKTWWTRDPHTEILHKRSYRILMQRSRQRSCTRDLAPEIRTQRSCASGPKRSWSCTRGPTGSWCRGPRTGILHKRSWDRDLAHEVLQDPAAEIPRRSYTSGSRETLHKSSYRILIQRFCTAAHTFIALKQEPFTSYWSTREKQGPVHLLLCSHLPGIHYFQQRKHLNTVWCLLPDNFFGFFHNSPVNSHSLVKFIGASHFGAWVLHVSKSTTCASLFIANWLSRKAAQRLGSLFVQVGQLSSEEGNNWSSLRGPTALHERKFS